MARSSTNTVVRVTSSFQVSIPKPIRERLGIKRGDLFDATPTNEGVLLRPKVIVDREDFLAALRQDIEASEADIAAGRVVGTFDNARDFAKAFVNYKKKVKPQHARRRS
jgi:AbrB family looped-hinge helix DNA binding protein